jgi:hypothetical protein
VVHQISLFFRPSPPSRTTVFYPATRPNRTTTQTLNTAWSLSINMGFAIPGPINSKRKWTRRAVHRKMTKSYLPARRCWLHGEVKAQDSSSIPPVQNTPQACEERQQCKEQMVLSGWCPHQVNTLSLKYDLKTFAYLASLETSPLRVADHQACSPHSSCIAYNTNPATYESRHITGGCECAMISVPYESLLKVLREGRVPLIAIESYGAGASEEYRLRIEARPNSSSYVVVTHVWADGLGNPHKNTLPLCQIKRLESNLQLLREVSTPLVALKRATQHTSY